MTDTSVLVAGRYRLDGRIAAGGVGEVWKGIDEVLGRPVAVKMLRGEYAQHPQALARFRAEARHEGATPDDGPAEPRRWPRDCSSRPSSASPRWPVRSATPHPGRPQPRRQHRQPGQLTSVPPH